LSGQLYDRIGTTYTATRGADPRIEARIRTALGDARSVVNVGAGAGAYEPDDRDVVAVEPSETMIAQRPAASPPVVRARAEELPFPDGAFDAAMAILSDHHWPNRARGLRELRRVARLRAIVFTWDESHADRFWLTRDYVPAFKALPGMPIETVAACLGGARIEPVPVPHDCRDGFYPAYWRRPDAYLDERVRAGISVFHRLNPREVEDAVARLRDDLESGEWHRRNGHLLELDECDFGYRLVIAEAGAP
jgi:SAM-dependent methyltransferase